MRAIISVSDKTGLAAFAAELAKLGVEVSAMSLLKGIRADLDAKGENRF